MHPSAGDGIRGLRVARVAWLLVTIAAWLIVIYVASHTSETPQIFHRYSRGYFGLLLVVVLLAVGVSFGNSERWLTSAFFSNMVVTVLSITLMLGVLEAFTRIVDPLGISYYDGSARYELDKLADRDLVFRHRPSRRATYNGVEARFNEYGHRDDPILPKGTSEYRVLALGDSVTFGTGVAQERTFCARLQPLLSAKLQRPVRVINTGVGGYNTVQEYNYLMKEGLSLDPDLVMLTYIRNDIEVNEGVFDPWSELALSGKSPPKVALLLIGKSWLFRVAYHWYRFGAHGIPTEQYALSAPSSRGWKESMESVRKLSAAARAHNIPLVIFFFRFYRDPLGDRLLGDVKEFAAPAAVEDTSTWFANVDPHYYVNSPVDAHPNAEGHALIAERMAAFLLTRIPPPGASRIPRWSSPIQATSDPEPAQR
jgi:lysophospholipase L1-like esterase